MQTEETGGAAFEHDSYLRLPEEKYSTDLYIVRLTTGISRDSAGCLAMRMTYARLCRASQPYPASNLESAPEPTLVSLLFLT